MEFKIENLILKMVSAEMRPAQSYDKDTKKWIKSGGEEKFFEYILVSDDEFSEKIVLNSKDDFSKLEGKPVTVVAGWKYDTFNKKMGGVRLSTILPA